MGLGSLALVGPAPRVWAGDAIPADKNFDPAWIASLTARGAPEVYTGENLRYIGMPVGGICTGQLYLGGDGRLWLWDIFNLLYNSGCSGARYLNPPKPADAMPVDQGFAITVSSGGAPHTCDLDKSGFPDIRFRGEYPIGKIDYAGPGIPVAVSLEAFSPFIPLNADDSGIPGTYFHYTVKNVSAQPVEATLTGWIQNAVCPKLEGASFLRRNKIIRGDGFTFVECSLEPPKADASGRPDVVFEDWHSPVYSGWTADGTAFGTGPVLRTGLPSYMGDVGGDTDRVVNSHASARGDGVGARDAQTGKLTSRLFTLERNYLNFWIGGGNHSQRTCLNLVVDGKVVRTATGKNASPLVQESFDLRPWAGKSASIEIVDLETGAWGNIGVGRIVLSDTPVVEKMEGRPDFGTMGLALLGPPAEAAWESFDKATRAAAPAGADTPPLGAVGRKLMLAPGESAEVIFAITWNFPNLAIAGLPNKGRYYATKYGSALAVARRLSCRPPVARTRSRAPLQGRGPPALAGFWSASPPMLSRAESMVREGLFPPRPAWPAPRQGSRLLRRGGDRRSSSARL